MPPQPVVSQEVVRLTPANMQRHGFELSASASASKRDASLRRVTLRFSATGHSIDRIETIALHIGRDAIVPLVLRRDLSLRFSLRKPLDRAEHRDPLGDRGPF